MAASGTRTGSARPRRSTCTSAGCGASSGDDPSDPRYIHTVRGVGLPLRAPGGAGPVSLRLRLLLALAYVLLLAIVALDVPLASACATAWTTRCARRRAAQADVVAATASALVAQGRRATSPGVALRPAVRGRVIIVERAGVVLADSAGAARSARDYSRAARDRRGALHGVSSQDVRYSETLERRPARHRGAGAPTSRHGGAVRITQRRGRVHRSLTRRRRRPRAHRRRRARDRARRPAAVIAGQIARPLRRLESTARRVADGDLDAPAGRGQLRAALARPLVQRDDRPDRPAPARSSASSSPTPRTSCARRSPACGCGSRRRGRSTPEPAAQAEIDAALGRGRPALATSSRAARAQRARERAPPEETSTSGDARPVRARALAAPPRSDAGVALQVHVDTRAGTGAAPLGDVDRVARRRSSRTRIRYAGAEATVTVAALPGRSRCATTGPGLAPGEEERGVRALPPRPAPAAARPGGTGLGLADRARARPALGRRGHAGLAARRRRDRPSRGPGPGGVSGRMDRATVKERCP